jgi:predicted methyltransferase
MTFKINEDNNNKNRCITPLHHNNNHNHNNNNHNHNHNHKCIRRIVINKCGVIILLRNYNEYKNNNNNKCHYLLPT